jgi:hypothetical protein
LIINQLVFYYSLLKFNQKRTDRLEIIASNGTTAYAY